MKAIATGMFPALLLAATGAAASTREVPAPKSVCLYSPRIDHTSVPDKNTILFHMKDGKIWKNTLKTPCPGLKFHGFVYQTHDMNICSNMQSITVLESNEVCMLGAFEPYSVPRPEKDKS